jgi:activator of HSP90 ATPase
MKTEKCNLSVVFPVSAKRLYDAWLSSREHSGFTGGKAVIQKKAGSRFSAWDQYIEGKILELEEGKRILQSWRTNDFPEDAEDSLLEISLEDTAKGCKLTLKHWNIPQGQGEEYKQGWKDYYFAPMKEYFKKK